MIALFDVTIPGVDGEAPVVDDLSLQIEEGSWNELVGPSGTGKTALFEVMTLRRRPARGRLVIAGRNVDRLGRRGVAGVRRDLGSCPQRPALLWERTVVENAVLPMVVRSRVDGAVDAAEEVLDSLGLLARRDRPVSTLSDQEQALVGLAMATVGRPSLVVIDGIRQKLESTARGMALSWLDRVCDGGSTVIIFGRRPLNRRAEAKVWRVRNGTVEASKAGGDRC